MVAFVLLCGCISHLTLVPETREVSFKSILALYQQGVSGQSGGILCGVLAMLGIQTFMIVAGVIKMIPLTGVTMPSLRYGGSSLLSCMAMIGILHGASARAQENLEEDILCVRG